MPEALIEEVHLAGANNFNKEKFNIKTVDDELRSYIIRKLNNIRKGLVTGAPLVASRRSESWSGRWTR